MKFFSIFLLKTLIFVAAATASLNQLCEKPINKLDKIQNTEFCECVTENSAIWGELVLVIDCSDKSLENNGFSAEKLPDQTVSLDASYNRFTKLPVFEGDELKFLDASYNKIDSLVSQNFIKTPSIVNLDLSYNAIQEIHVNAFYGLENLTQLNLAYNKIATLPTNVFTPLVNLEHLILSSNLNIGKTFHKVGVDLYATLGASPGLQKLEIERCDLSYIDLKRGSWLKELYMAQNHFMNVTGIASSVEVLDMSMNPIEVLSSKLLKELTNLKLLLMQDMPNLSTIEAMSLSHSSNLKHVSFRGSRKLSHLDPFAFGVMVKDDTKVNTHLEILNLQGANIASLNESLLPMFQKLKALDLDGNPITCNCNMKWISYLTLETNGQCTNPKHLRGVMLSGVPENKYECPYFPKWVYRTINGFIVLGVLIACSGAVWFIIIRLKRTTRHQSKIHTSSPYAPITKPVTTVNRADEAYY